jgi:hypothetical protein
MRNKNQFILFLCGVITIGLGGLAVWARGESGRTYTGIVEWRFEVSAFYPNGNCSAKPYWFSFDSEASGDIQKRWKEFGKPNALQVTFVGDLSRLGRWGHLGYYWREIRARTLIAAAPASHGCN